MPRDGLGVLLGALLATYSPACGTAHADTTQPPKRLVSAYIEGYFKPIACDPMASQCTAGSQLDALLYRVGLDKHGRNRAGEIAGVFALSHGFVITARLFDDSWPGIGLVDGWRLDGCRTGLVDIGIAVTDKPVRKTEFQEEFLLKMRTPLADLRPDQRTRDVPNRRYATIALRIETHCVWPKRDHVGVLSGDAALKAIERHLPGLLDAVEVR